MPEQLSKLLSALQVDLPELTQGEFWTIVILAVMVVGACLFVFLNPRNMGPNRGDPGPKKTAQ